MQAYIGRKIVRNKMKQLEASRKDESILFTTNEAPRVKLPPKVRSSKTNRRSRAARKNKSNHLATQNSVYVKIPNQFQDENVKKFPGAAVKDDFLPFDFSETPVVKLPPITSMEEKIDLNDISKYLPVDCFESFDHKMEDFRNGVDPAVNANNKFVNLPGEVLNLIMQHVFDEDECYEIKWRSGKRYQTHWRYIWHRGWLDPHTNHGVEQCFEDDDLPCWDYWKPSDYWSGRFTSTFITPVLNEPGTIERRKAFRPGYRRHHSPALRYVSGATAFLMVCRRFHDAGVSAFYSETSFSFGSVRLFSHFLKNLLPVTLPWLHTLYLNHEVYGHPMWTSMLGVRAGDERTWDRTCEYAATALTGLQSVHLLVRLKEFPPDLSLEAPWILSIVHFRAARLHQFELFLRSGPVLTDLNDPELRACVRMVRRAVLPHKFIDKYDFSNDDAVKDVADIKDPAAYVALHGAGRHEAERKSMIEDF